MNNWSDRNNELNRVGYLPHIDGIRTIAILLVVFFHAFPKTCPNGFIGVDVFFAISGYLITKNILSDIESKSFTLTRFYSRRFRRIVPAMVVVLATTWLIGRVILWADQFKLLGEHLRYAAAFILNIRLAREINYFDVSSELKPLLHFWSLGVEEQFYIFWPLILILGFRLPRSWRELIFASIAAGSVLYRFSSFNRLDVDRFYLIPARFWELMAGGTLAYLQFSRIPQFFKKTNESTIQKILSVAPIFALLFISFFYPIPRNENDLSYLVLTTLIPTVSSCFLIVFGCRSTFTRLFLSNPLMTFVGKISYPLYLWHWPVLSFLRIYYNQNGKVLESAPIIIVSVLVSIVLSVLTYFFVERPAQKMLFRGLPDRSVNFNYIKYTFVSLGLIASLGVFTAKGKLFNRDQEKQSQFTDAYFIYKQNPKYVSVAYRDECNLYSSPEIDSSCVTPKHKKIVFLWGDSHAQQLNLGLSSYLKDKSVALLQVTASMCLPSVEDSGAEYCNRSNRLALKHIGNVKPDVVLIAIDSAHEDLKWDKIFNKLRNLHVKKIIVVGPVPHWSPDLYRIVARYYLDTMPKYISHGISENMFRIDQKMKVQFKESFSDVLYISLLDKLCKEDHACLAMVGPDPQKDLIAHDWAHFTFSGSKYVGETVIGPILDRYLR